MKDNTIFDWLVQYHIEKNLEECKPYIHYGRVCHPANKGKSIDEGIENKAYAGICILKNGNTLINKLIKDGRINPKAVGEPVQMHSIDDFFTFMQTIENKEEDGVYIYESASKQLRRAPKIKDADKQERPLAERFPPNFIFYNGMPLDREDEEVFQQKLGNKTKLAAELTDAYPDVEAYMIKRSGYTPLGMGKVVHVTKNGLEEFFFKYNYSTIPEVKEKIMGVHRKYENQNGTWKKVKDESKEIMTLKEDTFDQNNNISYPKYHQYIEQALLNRMPSKVKIYHYGVLAN